MVVGGSELDMVGLQVVEECPTLEVPLLIIVSEWHNSNFLSEACPLIYI